MNDSDLTALWKEIRILQLQMASLQGWTMAKLSKRKRVAFLAVMSREHNEAAERIDAEMEE